MLRIFSIITINLYLQILIFLYHFDQFHLINQTTANSFDYLFYTFYAFSVFLLFRVFFYISFFWEKSRNTVFWPPYFYSMEFVFLLFTVVDSKVYLSQGVHLYDPVVVATLQNPNANRELQIGFSTVANFLGISFMIILFLTANSFLIKKFRPTLIRARRYLFISTCILLPLKAVMAGWVNFQYLPQRGEVSHIYPFYTLINPIPAQENLKAHYPKTIQSSKKNGPPRSILFIMAESLRSDMFSPFYMPKLHNFIKKNSTCLAKENHFSGGHTTEIGVFTGLYGVNGNHYHNFRWGQIDPAGPKILKQNDYQVLAGTSSQLRRWNKAGFVFNVFHTYKEFKGKKIYLDDQKLAKWARTKIRQFLERDDPFFMFLFFNSTHHSYYYPKKYERFRPAMGEDFNHLKTATTDRVDQSLIFNRYKNAVYYLDHLLTNFIISTQNSKNPPIIVLTGDHGEEFWDENLFGHGKSNFINSRIKVPLVFCQIDKSGQKAIGSHYISYHPDIFPTLLNLANISFPSKLFNGIDLSHKSTGPRTLPITGGQFPYKGHYMGLVTNSHKYWLRKRGKKLSQFQLVRSTNLFDRSKSTNEVQQDFDKALAMFRRDAYRFLTRP